MSKSTPKPGMPEISVIRMNGEPSTRSRMAEVEIRVGRAVACGSYNGQGYGSLDHAPTQSDMARVSRAVDRIEDAIWADMVQSAVFRWNHGLQAVRS